MQQQATPYIVAFCEAQIEILYEDDYLLLINKPEGLLSMPGVNPLNHDSVITRLTKIYPAAGLVHRLDLDTSGIMIIPLNKMVLAHISKQFQARTVNKTYTAVLAGHLLHDKGEINYPLIKDWPNPPLHKVCYETGKASLTHYEVLERLNDPKKTRVLFTPVTGRTHQLRIHSREIGHPICGCDLYADDAAFALADRLMLHATSIDFTHPITGERIQGHAPAPF